MNKEVDIVDVVESYGIRLKREGSEWIGLCPFHDDHHSSLRVNQNKQIFKCFACGQGGDYYTFQKLMGDKPEILEKVERQNAKASFVPMIPVPANMAESPSFQHSRLGMPTTIYRYLGTDESLLGFVCRFDKEDGSKEVMPYVYGEVKGIGRWRYAGFPEPRPLYGLWDLYWYSKIIIVEGEKTADYLRNALGNSLASSGYAVISWIGGASSVHKSSWSIVQNKHVYLWPDNDAPGEEAMSDVTTELTGLGNKIFVIENEKTFPEHWDVADSGWDGDQIMKYIETHVR